MREPFVIVAGAPRSGTSLLRTLLRSHPSLIVHKTEPHYLLELHRRFGSTIRDVPGAVDFLVTHEKFPATEVDLAALRRDTAGRAEISLADLLRTAYRLLRGGRSEAPLVLKHPSFILHLDLMRELFPDLVVVHLIRDPRANAFSQRTRWPSTSLWTSATLWQGSIDAGRSWQQRGLTPYLELRYEDLLTSPEASCTTLCAFLGIPYDPAMLATTHVERQWDPNNPGEGTKREYQGFERARIDKWRKFMTPAEIKLIEDQCRRGMALFGYPALEPSVPLMTYMPLYLRERRRALEKSFRRMRRRRRS